MTSTSLKRTASFASMSKVYTTDQYKVILSALDKLDAYVRPTYGPGGRGILVDFGMYQKMLDDGYMAIDEFELDDPLENAVIKFVRSASFQANKRAGDGTTTATLLMISIVREMLKAPQKLNAVVRDMNVAATEALLAIHGSRRLIDSQIDLYQIAFNAYRDPGSAAIVSRVVKEIGPDGVITVQAGEALETASSVVLGMSVGSGFYSPYLANEAGKVEIDDARILLTTSRIVTNRQLLPILEKLVASGSRKLLIVCDDMEGEAMTTVIMNRMRNTLDIMVVKAPFAGTAKKDFLDDLGVVTGATVVDDSTGVTMENVGLGALGKATKVITTNDRTIVIGGQGIAGQLEKRVEAVRELLAEQPNNDAIAARLARLTGGIGLIKVGAASEAEIATKKAKIEDAVHATQLAYKTGVVAGGANAFLVTTSCAELNRALLYPRAVLEANGAELLDPESEDAYGVVQSALESGVSIATLLLNCGGIITKANDKSTTV